MKDHEKAQLVNKLRDIAIEFHNLGQLRSRIQAVLLPALSSVPASPVAETVSDAARNSVIQRLMGKWQEARNGSTTIDRETLADAVEGLRKSVPVAHPTDKKGQP